MISAGAKKDLLVVSFVHAILNTAKVKGFENVISIPNSKEKKRIERRCGNIEKACDNAIKSSITPVSEKWFKSQLKSKILKALMLIKDDVVQLESFAIYVLYINFYDNRTKKIDKIFDNVLLDDGFIFDTLDLISKAIGRDPDDMYDMAIKAIGIIKG